MQQAVKQVAREIATDLSDEVLVPNNDVSSVPNNRNIAALRKKIKSARLEKLMARQLEDELSIDHIEIEDPQGSNPDAMPVFQHEDDIAKATDASFEEPYVNYRPHSKHSSSKARAIDLHQSLRHCGEMLQKITISSQALTDLSSHASGLETFLRTVEQDLAALERSEIRVKELEEISDQQRIQIQEFRAEAKKQKKQIEMLETMHKSSLSSNEKTNNELARVQNTIRKKEREISNLHASVSESEQARNSVKSDLNKLTVELSHSNQTLSASRDKLRIKDVEITKLVAEVNSLTAENDHALDKYADIQAKYDDANKRYLEQQNQHYTKIHSLENQVRELKQQLESNNREKAELSVELNAANNLLVLHEEMISALSPIDDE